jgi:DNA-directed RNA polymerase subunit RPC12/RpoP
MIPPAFSDSPNSIEANDFEQLVQDGILAVKNGNRTLAIKLFEQAALINDTDVRIWIWMSATTDDLEERRQYLEHAVALDPSNTTAKRGLLIVTGKLDQARLNQESTQSTQQGAPPTEAASKTEAAPQTEARSIEEATTKTYLCPNCGATISYNIQETVLVCQFCGFTRKVDGQVQAESKDQPLDEVLPTTRAHRWAESQQKVTCEQCGVTILLPPGQTADTCPYCASNRFISSATLVEMVDPQTIGIFKIDPQKAGEEIKAWLGKGMFSPDNLATEHAGMQLHPAYYPFWLFEGTVEIPWFCDVNVGTSKLPQWEAHTGSQFENFKDVLIPGLRKLLPADLIGIEPFKVDELVDFSPDYLAGWVALTYDIALSDASLKAREKVVKSVQGSIESLAESNHPKRNFSTGAGKWSGLTYKLALLPIYMGNYVFQGQRYHLLINGQTGKVSGKKPVDRLKAALVAVIGFILLALLIFFIFILVIK